MRSNVKTPKIAGWLIVLGILIQTFYVVQMQVRFTPMLEDLDFMNNLSTQEPISSLGDLFANLGFIYKNMGGSMVCGLILSVILSMHPYVADVLNLLVMLGISFLICRAIGAKQQQVLFFAIPYFTLISLNDDWEYCYLWQFGVVNYLCPAILLLLYLTVYARAVDAPKSKTKNAEMLLVLFAGLFAGMMNPAYGLVCVAIAVLAILLEKLVLGVSPYNWMYVGGGASFLGVLLYMITPGNYDNESFLQGIYLTFSVFPAVVLALVMLAVILRTGGYLKTSQLLMLGVLGISVGLNFLITWLPFVGANGILVCTLILSITLFCNLLYQMNLQFPKHRVVGYIIAVIALLYSVLLILENYEGVL